MNKDAAAQTPPDTSDDIFAEFEDLKAMSITICETATRIAKEELEESKRALKPATKRQRASNPNDASSSDEQSSTFGAKSAPFAAPATPAAAPSSASGITLGTASPAARPKTPVQLPAEKPPLLQELRTASDDDVAAFAADDEDAAVEQQATLSSLEGRATSQGAGACERLEAKQQPNRKADLNYCGSTLHLDTNHQPTRYRVISMSTTTNKAEQAVSYAALILADEGIAITPDKLQALLKAAGIEDVELIWTTLFSNAFRDKNVKDLILTATTATPAGRGTASDTKDDEKTTGEDGDDEKDGEEGMDIDADSDDGSTFGDLFG
ncbi:hypothetical protein J4E90_008224 [Alternaria incomplexa]|uniref:uncharacterized protein n=1 Tax=Alternaria incomplexa TaxID=1187928 RepID=UPI00222084C8|nr:uncharacterized protein J4E90_008224 [Alternaria incomplexa]KAI4909527.1 hypothetical protein J4E90_008224 [Alternaria incomplexa]